MEENNLQDGWIVIPFTELLDIQGGTQPPKNTFKYLPTKGYIRLLQIRDFGEKPQPTFILERPQLKTCNEDDILIARYGASIGRIVTGMKGAYNVALAKVIIPQTLNKNFIKYLLKSEIFQRPILSIQRSAQDGFNKEDLAEIEIPLPPLPEQERIVTKLDAVMQKIESNKQRLENIAQFEYKIFLQNIYDGSEFYDSVKLGEYCEEQITPIRKEWANHRLIGVSKDNGVVDLRTGGKKTFERYKIVKPGWFLYNPMRVDIGSIALWNGNEIAITSPDYVVFSIKKSLSPSMLLKFLKSKYGLSEINNNKQGAVRSRLYFRNLANIDFPFSGEKNHKNAELLFKGFSKLSTRKKIIENLISKLKESILAKAFRGELVSQNPNDEPASVLLERIKKEKEKKHNAKKGAKEK